jgi:anaerobic ribonucleoside-triphosphate reductase
MIPSRNAATRLAQLDIERYGWAKVPAKGSKELPFYTDLIAVPINAKVGFDERLRVEEKIQQLTPGGHLALIQVEEVEPDADRLLTVSRQLTSDSNIDFYTFNRDFAYCGHCRKISSNGPTKCPFCGSVDNLVRYRRVSARYEKVMS